jgi:DnaK suppressor protein
MPDTHALERIRKALLDRRAQLASEIEDGQRRRLEEESGEGMADVGDNSDVATATEQADLRSAQIERDALELKAVEAALARIAQGQYGTCVRCGREIGEARLRANPIADRCIECQTIVERQFARRPSSL